MSHDTWNGAARNDMVSHKNQHAGFHYNDSDYDGDEGEDGEEINEYSEFDYDQEDHSSFSSERSYDQYGGSRLTSCCTSVVGHLLMGEHMNH